MEETALTIQVLREIRDEVRKTNGRVDETNARLDQTNARLDETNTRIAALGEELGRRIVESELRTATALTELAGSVREVTFLFKGQLDLRPRVERCEEDIRELRRELGRRH